MIPAFHDHFSGHADAYAAYRPTYPAALFTFLASQAPDRLCAWDCATGNGQAALALANEFESVIATDASAQQIEEAALDKRVNYYEAPAEASLIDDHSVSLITVAQALHWFDFDAFYKEVRRVTKPNGLLAAWTYGLTRISDRIDPIVDDFYHNTVGEFWPPESRYIENEYRDMPFPFEELELPSFEIEAIWSAADFLNFLRTWSSVKRYIKAHGKDPVSAIEPSITARWPGPSCSVRWPLTVRLGRI